MKFIVDAHFPYKLARFIQNKGFDAIHTDDLPLKERTSDNEIRRIANEDNRVVITKDNDFLDSYLLLNNPRVLLLVTTGNIRNPVLMTLFESYWEEIIQVFAVHNFIELNNAGLFVRDN